MFTSPAAGRDDTALDRLRASGKTLTTIETLQMFLHSYSREVLARLASGDSEYQTLLERRAEAKVLLRLQQDLEELRR